MGDALLVGLAWFFYTQARLPLNGPTLVTPQGREEVPTHENIHFPCVENFVEAVLDGKPLLSSGRTALWTDWVTERAVKDNLRA